MHLDANMAVYLYENGSWGITDGNAVSGWCLAIVWAGEIAAIPWCSVYFARSRVAHQPFRETCDRWTETELQIQTFIADVSEAIWHALTAASPRTLIDFPLADVTSKLTLRVTVAIAPVD